MIVVSLMLIDLLRGKGFQWVRERLDRVTIGR